MPPHVTNIRRSIWNMRGWNFFRKQYFHKPKLKNHLSKLRLKRKP